jgi:hypothetical protein
VIVALRVLLLVIAAAALAAAVAIGIRSHGDQSVSAVRYACPMHREVRSAGPGECPICRMALERVGRPTGPATRASNQDAADLAAVENVRKHNIVDFVRKRSLLVPARELRGPAWVDGTGVVTALFYDDEIEALGADETGLFIPTAAPGTGFAVRRSADLAAPWDSSTSRIRFRFQASRPQGTSLPRPAPNHAGQVGWLELAPRPRQVLAVPASAVLQSPEGPYVLAWTGTGFNFEKRPIKIGETFLRQGFAVVLSGLDVNERIVSRATFFLEAERRSTSRADETGWSSL